MSLTTLFMPIVSSYWLGERRLLAKRARAERRRVASGQAHVVHYFHQVDDPYSALAAAGLSRLLVRYDITLQAHVVDPPSDALTPERARLQTYSRSDAQRLAPRVQLSFQDPGKQPTPDQVQWAQAALVGAIDAGTFVRIVDSVSQWLWASESAPVARPTFARAAMPAEVNAHLQRSQALQDRWTHAGGASFYYEGEWYWGIDRLYHLEQRLQTLGAQRGARAPDGEIFPMSPDWQTPVPVRHATVIDFYFSLRSPYSALAVPRVFELAQLSGVAVRLRYLLPMVMRGLPVPRQKRQYIAQDAAREARARHIAFGRVNDPVGRPTERGLALIDWAESQGKGQAYVQSFMRGVWAEGLDAGSTRGLRCIVERAGLSWSQAQAPLHSDAWRSVAEANRAELFALGLWGVPSFRVGDTVVWGQDRLWAIHEALTRQDIYPTRA